MKRKIAVLLATVMILSGIQSGSVFAANTYSVLSPNGLFVKGNNLFVCDGGSNTVKKLSGKKVTDYIGSDVLTGVNGFAEDAYLNGTFNASLFAEPYDMAWFTAVTKNAKKGKDSKAAGYAISDTANNTIRFATGDVVLTIAGQTKAGSKNGYSTKATFNGPKGLATDKAGNLYIADCYNNMIRKMDKYGNVTTLAGSKKAGKSDGKGKKASFREPSGLCVSGNSLYVTDSGNHSIRKIDLKTGKVTTIAGFDYKVYKNSKDSVLLGEYKDGDVKKAKFDNPQGIAVKDGAIYVADCGNSAIRCIYNGKVSTIDKLSGDDDNAPVRPVGLCFKGEELFVSDSFSGIVYSLPKKVWKNE